MCELQKIKPMSAHLGFFGNYCSIESEFDKIIREIKTAAVAAV